MHTRAQGWLAPLGNPTHTPTHPHAKPVRQARKQTNQAAHSRGPHMGRCGDAFTAVLEAIQLKESQKSVVNSQGESADASKGQKGEAKVSRDVTSQAEVCLRHPQAHTHVIQSQSAGSKPTSTRASAAGRQTGRRSICGGGPRTAGSTCRGTLAPSLQAWAASTPRKRPGHQSRVHTSLHRNFETHTHTLCPPAHTHAHPSSKLVASSARVVSRCAGSASVTHTHSHNPHHSAAHLLSAAAAASTSCPHAPNSPQPMLALPQQQRPKHPSLLQCATN